MCLLHKLTKKSHRENIISDCKLIAHCSLRLDILYFIGYDIDEELPWHSTISRTRQLFPESVFEEVFTKVLRMCVEKGMVSGHTQAIDSAPVKANASMDREKPHRKSKGDRSDKGQRSVSAGKNELAAIKGRNKKWAKDQDQRPGGGQQGSQVYEQQNALQPHGPRCPYQRKAR
nr:transposase [Zobellia laminariae]